MRVLIVGCGYVGLPLGKELARQGHEVFGLRRSALAEAELLATGITPKSAKFLVDAMDGADAMAVNQVILFLCGSGRRSSR